MIGRYLLFVSHRLCQLHANLHLTYMCHAKSPSAVSYLVREIVKIGIQLPCSGQHGDNVLVDLRRWYSISLQQHAHHDEFRWIW